MSPVLIPKVDETLARFSGEELRRLAADAIGSESAAEVADRAAALLRGAV
jgi:hypothetical protein